MAQEDSRDTVTECFSNTNKLNTALARRSIGYWLATPLDRHHLANSLREPTGLTPVCYFSQQLDRKERASN